MDVRHNQFEVETIPIRAHKSFKFRGRNTLGSYLQGLRVLKGLVQPELAERIGVHPSTIWRWEYDYDVPRQTLMRKLVRALEADPTELVQYEGVLNERQKKILTFLRENPESTQRECREAVGVNRDLHDDLLYLMDIGILERVFRGRTAYYWVRK